jgi:hypothetical protein
MALLKRKNNLTWNMIGREVPESRDDLYLADGSIPKLPRLLPNGINNPNNMFWNK